MHWVHADFDAWMHPNQIEWLDPSLRLIAIYERDGHEGRIFRRYMLELRAGLEHSWAVELFPNNVVRTVRTDGSAWTFEWYPLFERAYPIHTLDESVPTDDAAEALTIAELALSSEPVL